MPGYDGIKLRFTGVFSHVSSVRLAAVSSFAEGFHRIPEDGDGAVLDLAFLLEDSWSTVAMRLYARDGQVTWSTSKGHRIFLNHAAELSGNAFPPYTRRPSTKLWKGARGASSAARTRFAEFSVGALAETIYI